MKKSLFSLMLLGLSSLIFSQTVPKNTRFIEPTKTQGNFSLGFVKHLNSAKSDMFFSTIADSNSNYFAEIASTRNVRFISRIAANGLPLWSAKFIGDNKNYELNTNNDFACVDKDDNFLIFCNTSNPSATFIDAIGNTENITNSFSQLKVLIKLDKNGNKIWFKKFENSNIGVQAAVSTDANGDVFVLGTNGGNQNLILDGITLGKTFIVKLSATTGNIIYTKSFNYQSFQLHPVFDAQNNLYVFTEPNESSSVTSFVYDGITIPRNIHYTDNLMLKFDASGTVIWGKNFYANTTDNCYSWINEALFDGTNFILMGVFADYSQFGNNYFTGLDGVNVPKTYSNTNTDAGLFAKVDTSGNVIFQKSLESNVSNFTGFYTNMNLDENKNAYGYFWNKDKLKINGTEYSFDTTNGNKILIKFDTNGNVIYTASEDISVSSIVNSNAMIDVIGEDKINITAFTTLNNFQNYPINNTASPKQYIATFGNLDLKYLTPENNYLELSSLAVTNNSLPATNEFSFDLINNVDWSASSDQSWLNLSFVNLTGKSPQSTITGNGDAKITFTATENSSGNQRDANVVVSGTGVSSKTIIVSQTGALKTGESKISLTTLYPNPTSDYLNIKSDKNIKKVELFDMSGKLVLSSKLENQRISVSKLLKGIYVVKIYTDNEVLNSKFIKN